MPGTYAVTSDEVGEVSTGLVPEVFGLERNEIEVQVVHR